MSCINYILLGVGFDGAIGEFGSKNSWISTPSRHRSPRPINPVLSPYKRNVRFAPLARCAPYGPCVPFVRYAPPLPYVSYVPYACYVPYAPYAPCAPCACSVPPLCPMRPCCALCPMRPLCALCALCPLCPMRPLWPCCALCPISPLCALCRLCSRRALCPFRPMRALCTLCPIHPLCPFYPLCALCPLCPAMPCSPPLSGISPYMVICAARRPMSGICMGAYLYRPSPPLQRAAVRRCEPFWEPPVPRMTVHPGLPLQVALVRFGRSRPYFGRA